MTGSRVLYDIQFPFRVRDAPHGVPYSPDAQCLGASLGLLPRASRSPILINTLYGKSRYVIIAQGGGDDEGMAPDGFTSVSGSRQPYGCL